MKRHAIGIAAALALLGQQGAAVAQDPALLMPSIHE
jgi:hypothetical protein